jgi:TolB-like protein/class 3 adenylate cyclase/Flp pilus assembly protein TadD
MSSSTSSELKFDIGHVLFIDIVGYSKLLLAEQSNQMQTLREIVRGTEQFKKAEAEGKLLRLPTGDGGALVFRNSLEAPVLCALEISKALKSHPELKVRMGIHSGPVNEITDLNEQANIAGVGINMAQRVMDCGDAGHILLSKRVADDLEQYPQWRSHLSDLGDCEVKHGTRVSVVNLYTDDAGNRQPPEKFRTAGAGPSRTVGVPAPRDRTKGKHLLIGAAALVLIALGLAAFQLLRPKSHLEGGAPATPSAEGLAGARPSIPEKSIAVLPFENLSDDKSNAYFAEGIQDEILTRLSKIAALKVISRTSTQKYKSAPDNLRDVGQQLGVANLLEGSVQKAGNAVHINVQLIKAATDEHLWAESYDRELQNIFGVEGEVAGAIADQLNAKLSGNEKRELGARPTKNPDAYDAYLRGLAFASGVEDFRTALTKSVQAFEKAVQLDPEFAVAWAHLPRQYGLMFINNIDVTPQRRDLARNALDMAVKFGPDLVETKLADGFYKYFFERDYEGAKAQFEAVRRQYPNNAVAAEYLGGMARRQGQWEKSAEFYAQAIELDPQNIFLLVDAAITDLARRDVAAAQKHLGRARDLSPENSTIISFLAISFQLTGDMAQAQALLDTVHPKPGDSVYVGTAVTNAILTRKYDSAIAMLKAQLEHPEALGNAVGSFENSLGDVQRHAGQLAEATAAYQQAKQAVNEFLRTQPDNTEFLNELAWAETWLGDKAAAFTHIQRAIAALPTSKDALLGPSYEDTLARIEAHFGEKEKAIAAVQHLLRISYASPVLTPALLRIDPDWDNLRDDPRFEKLCQEK